MRQIPLFLVFFFSLALCASVPSQEARQRNDSELALRKELLERVERDQAIREEQIAAGISSPNEDIAARMQAMDSANTVRMKEIIAKYGWPSPKLVGRDGVQAAFLLVQHADFDFQKEVLPLVEKAFRDGKLPGHNYALLLDRVLIRDGKPQVYGTQAKVHGAEITFEPIDDEPNVDKRRSEIGLPPIADYRKMLKDVYFPQQNKKE